VARRELLPIHWLFSSSYDLGTAGRPGSPATRPGEKRNKVTARHGTTIARSGSAKKCKTGGVSSQQNAPREQKKERIFRRKSKRGVRDSESQRKNPEDHPTKSPTEGKQRKTGSQIIEAGEYDSARPPARGGGRKKNRTRARRWRGIPASINPREPPGRNRGNNNLHITK